MHIRSIAVLAALTLTGGNTMVRAQDRPPNPLAPRAPFAGKFAGEGLVLELAAQGQAYTGTLTFQGQQMPCRAQAQGQGLAGTFDAGGNDFPFEAAPDGQGGLRLSSGGRTYALKPETPRNPLAGGTGPAPGPAPAAGDLTVEAKHPIGVLAKLPTGWTIQEYERGTMLIPPGVNPQDPKGDEVHFLLAEQTDPSIQSPADPRVVQYMDQLIGGMSPTMRRGGEPQVVQTGAGATAVMNWTGTAPDGSPVSARAYVAIVGQNGAAILTLASAAKLATRDATMRAIAGSMKAFVSEMNPRLVGKWGRNGGWSIAGNHGAGGASGDSRVEMTLGQGGRLYEYSLSYVSTPAGIIENKEEKHGTWTANGAVLTLRYQNGEVQQYRYQITPQGLVCTNASGGSATWLPSR